MRDLLDKELKNRNRTKDSFTKNVKAKTLKLP